MGQEFQSADIAVFEFPEGLMLVLNDSLYILPCHKRLGEKTLQAGAQGCKMGPDRGRRRSFDRSRSILLTIHVPSWYYQPAKKPAVGWSTVLNQEKLISATEFRVNEGIRVAEVRLIGPDGSNVGVVPMRQALQIARDAELDLVEVSPNANPPVCRVIDYLSLIHI